ncbi:hypothetical protein [Streptomyces sp. NPDC088746]|uniref:hypothetical protein n=1 Tax=Streptomyces sp. NPDC088746 TaxID=3365885 RepID=UPI00382B0EE7
MSRPRSRRARDDAGRLPGTACPERPYREGKSNVTVAHHFRIAVSAAAPAGAAPETAAVRLITLLPAPWTGAIVECADGAAVIAVTPPGAVSAPEVERTVEEIVRGRALTGWTSSPVEHDA